MSEPERTLRAPNPELQTCDGAVEFRQRRPEPSDLTDVSLDTGELRLDGVGGGSHGLPGGMS